MISRLPSVGVVLAGGVGLRVGHSAPKQLIKLAGRTILEHTIALFDASPDIDEVVVLMTPGFLEPVRELVRRCGFGKVTAIVEGGASRTESTWRALRAVGDRECNVLLHDAVRPLLEPRIIADCVRALETYEAVEVAIPSSDTVLVAEGDLVREVLDRSRLRRAQTPQAFRLSVIREAYRRAMADPAFATAQATDDCGVVLRYLPEVPIYLVPGSERNMKVTHPMDLSIAEQLLRQTAAPPSRGPSSLDGRTVVVFGDSAPLAALVSEHGAAVRAFPADLARTEELAAKALAEAGRVDHVIHLGGPPAGGDDPALPATGPGEPGIPGDLLNTGPEALACAYLGAANVARAAYPVLRESGGTLVLQAGGEGSLAAPVKAATAELARALAADWGPTGVRVNAVLTNASPALTPRPAASDTAPPDSRAAHPAAATAPPDSRAAHPTAAGAPPESPPPGGPAISAGAPRPRTGGSPADPPPGDSADIPGPYLDGSGTESADVTRSRVAAPRVARACLDVLVSGASGHVVEV